MDIKDYLHLYLGCLYQWQDADGEWRRIQPLTAYQLNDVRSYHINARLILRQLSDMTHKEAIKLISMRSDVYKQISIGSVNRNVLCFEFEYESSRRRRSQTMDFRRIDANQFKYLLENSFDLFGLIDAGLAIDKTKL